MKSDEDETLCFSSDRRENTRLNRGDFFKGVRQLGVSRACSLTSDKTAKRFETQWILLYKRKAPYDKINIELLVLTKTFFCDKI